MVPSLIRKTLRDDRRAFIGWAVGLTAFVLVYGGFYPQFKDGLAQAKMESMPAAMKQFMGLRDVASAAGYLEMTVYTLTGPLLMIVLGVVLGTRAVAGPEEGHTLEMFLANPISRRRFVLARFVTLAAQVVTLGLIPWLILLGLSAAFKMDVPAANLSSASLAMMLLGLLFGTLALAAGAVTGRRGTALTVGAVAAVAAYVIHGLGNQIESLHWMRWLSPFHYYIGTDPLRTGFHLTSVLVPVVCVALLAAVAAVGFERRDVAA
jgi:ABC-2 type transport system permease protein